MYLAYFLQNRDNHLEVSNVKSRECQPDMTKVAIASQEILVASLTFSTFHSDTHTAVQSAIGSSYAIIVDIIKPLVANLENSLIHDVLL
jgi:hypothetical protein